MADIAEATKTLEELIAILDHTYWESNHVDQKDRVYDIIHAVYRELSELSKLSIQDHGLEYEPVTADFRLARAKLNILRATIEDSVFRASTAASLEASIVAVVTLGEV